MKGELEKVGRWFIREMLPLLVTLGGVAWAFGDLRLIGWGIIGYMFSFTTR